MFSLMIVSTWILSMVVLCGSYICKDVSCCSSSVILNVNEGSPILRALHCNMASCKISTSQNIQTKKTEVSSLQKERLISNIVISTRKDLDFPENSLSTSSANQRIRDGCSTYLRLQHFLI